MKKAGLSISRRSLLAAGASLAGASLLTPGKVWAQAISVPTIPTKTVRHAVFGVTSHAWTVLAQTKGYLNDVGLSMAGGAPKVSLEQEINPQLVNGETDIVTSYMGMLINAMHKLPNVRPVMVFEYYQGNTILTSPDSGFKSVDEFMAGGMPWKEAAAATMMQLKGQKMAITASSSTYPFNEFAFSLAGLKMADADTVPVEDPKAVQLALGNQVAFAAPGGAVQVYQLQHQANWKPVMSMKQLLANMGGANSPVNNLINYDHMQCTQEYLDANRDTVLRWCGAMYRTLDYIFGPKQEQALNEYAPFINAQTGAELDAGAIKFIFEVMDPFLLWKDQPSIWEDTKYPLYYKSLYEFQMKTYLASGTLPPGNYDLEKLFAAKPIFFEMRDMKKKTTDLLAKIKPGDSVSKDRQDLIDKAKFHYDGYNFLDASRFAEAALA